ncbi:MAG: hypothetical protein JWO51_2530 [Rhodospirillales bacterium]|nr:hypothetical protein [Rhodospirillales bacterium]
MPQFRSDDNRAGLQGRGASGAVSEQIGPAASQEGTIRPHHGTTDPTRAEQVNGPSQIVITGLDGYGSTETIRFRQRSVNDVRLWRMPGSR